MIWHNRLGHLNSNDLSRMINDKLLPGYLKAKNLSKCEICLKGKMTNSPFIKTNKSCRELLEIIHSDVVGPFRNAAYDGSRYFVTFIDDNSRWCEVYFLREKSGVLDAFKAYHRQVEKQTGKQIKFLQSDNGGEYVNNKFDDYLSEHGIKRRLSIPHTPQQNGVAERMNRTLLDMTRCLLLQSGLDQSLWSVSVATACYIRNRCPSNTLNWKTPFEKIYGRKPGIKHLRTFGSNVIILDKNPTKSKLAPRALKGIFVGYPKDQKGYRVWIPSTRKMAISRDIKFLNECENASNNNISSDVLNVKLDVKEDDSKHIEFYSCLDKRQKVSSQNNEFVTENNELTIENNEHIIEDNNEEEERQTITRRHGPGRPKIIRTGARGRPRKKYCIRTISENEAEKINSRSGSESDSVDEQNSENGSESGDLYLSLEEENSENNNLSNHEQGSENLNESNELNMFVAIAEVNIKDAITGNEKDEWLDAIESEFTSLIKNKTWEVIKATEVKNLVGCRFILTNKCDANGNIERRKARLVAKGYSQKYGVDYYETFAPVARLETLRLLLALSVHFNLKIWQFDVVTAYLNGNLNEKVLMKIPDMLGTMLERIIHKQGKNSEIGKNAVKMDLNLREGGNTCILKKALYGLKQAGRQWYAKLSEKLKAIGLKCTKNEPCLFFGKVKEELIFLLIYVDDILVAARDKKLVSKIQSDLMEDFELKDFGLAKYCLGLQIEETAGEIKLKQTGYINELLKKYGMYNCNSVSTPAEVNTCLNDTKSSNFEGNNYREVIGALMYLTVATRPDISNTVSRLAQFVNNPMNCHWNSLKRIFRYLSGTADLGLIYKKTEYPLIAFTDADWGGCSLDRRSYTGYVYILSGAAITWKSQKQRTVALSSTEAEYVSLAEVAKEAIYLRSLLNELDLMNFANTTIYVDNKGAEQIAKNPVFHARTKHIDLRHHFVRESLQSGLFSLKHVSTKNMIADILTKPLLKISHNMCMKGV